MSISQTMIFSKKPNSTFLFTTDFSGSKVEFLQQLLDRKWGEKEASLWLINEKDGLSTSRPKELIQESLSALQKKMSHHDFQNASSSFRLRCGELREGGICDEIDSTYIWLSINSDFLQKYLSGAKFCIKPDKHSRKSHKFTQQQIKIQAIHVLLANSNLVIVIIETKHTSDSISQFITDLHPFQKSLFRCFLSLREIVPKDQNIPPKSNNNLGYLAQYISRLEEDSDSNPCPFLGFCGWLLFADWTVPEKISENVRDLEGFPLYSKMINNHFVYRMHCLEVESEHWDLREEIFYYVRRGVKLQGDIFVPLEEEAPFVNTYASNSDHYWSISRDALVSITKKNDSKYDFVNQRFTKGYEILTLQVLVEYMGCQFFNYRVASLAYKRWQENTNEQRNIFSQLLFEMNQFRLGVNLVDFSTKASEARFYDALRKAFRVDVLLKELSDEIEDVHSIINEQDKKIERQRSEERQEVRRKKERDERRKKEEIEREENYEKEKREKNERNKEKVLSIIGAATIPFALISGLMGMNTNLSECSMQGRIPCVSFWTVVGICFLLFFVIYFFLNRTLRSEEQDNPSSKKNNEPKLISSNNHEEVTDLKTKKGELVTPSQSDS